MSNGTQSLNAVTDWSLSSLFDRTIPRACPVANSSHVRVDLSEQETGSYTLTPDASQSGEHHVVYDITKGSHPDPPALHVSFI